MPTYGKYRNRIFAKGLGNFAVLELSPTPDTLFRDPGYLENTSFKDATEVDIHKDENGNVIRALENSREVSFNTMLKQSSIDEINLLRNAGGKIYAVRYYGLTRSNVFQYYACESGQIVPGVEIPFGKGSRLLPLRFIAHDISDEMGFTVDPVYIAETAGEIYVEDLQLWISPRLGYNAETLKVLDISGWGRHGTLTADYAVIWDTASYPERFLKFDGADDYLSLGDICDDDGSTDFWIDGWIKIPAANGTLTEILGKKELISDHTAGFALWRTAANLISFKLSDGDESASVVSAATVLQNVWTHIAVAIDRNGNVQIYINGVASGSPVSVADVESGANALNLYIGGVNTSELGQVNISDMRIHRCASGLPAAIATLISNHYNAEKTIHGL